MKRIILAIALSLSLLSTAYAGIPAAAVRTTDVKDICTTRTSTIRDVPEAVKKQVYRNANINYGDRTLCTNGYEVDHRISLTLGGTNDISNLQLQAYCTKEELAPNFPKGVLYDAHKKDILENVLHRDICVGATTPSQAQDQIYNWHN